MPVPRPDPEPAATSGFTIVETLVALFAFALAGVALIAMQSQSVGALSRVEARALASLAAENNVIDALAKRSPLEVGTRMGEVAFGGRSWQWTLEVAGTDDPTTLRLKSTVVNSGSSEVSVTAYAIAGGTR